MTDVSSEVAVKLGPEDEIWVILEQVRAVGLADATQPNPMLDALLSMAECGPDICEAFFTTLQDAPAAQDRSNSSIMPAPAPGNLFSLCLELLSEASAPLASQLASILVVVVRKVGIGVAALRQMIDRLYNDKNRWSKSARQVLSCMHQMAQLETGEAPPRKEPQSFFVLDGLRSGLYLGGDADWVWGDGYTFAAWIWKDGNEQGDVTLLRLLSSEFEGKKANSVVQLVIRTDKNSGRGVARLIVMIGDGSRTCEADTNLVLPTSRWTHVAVSHEYNQLKSSVLTAHVDKSKFVTALKYPAAQLHVRAYVGCSGCTRGALPTQRNFKGLLASVSIWCRPMSSDAIEENALQAAASFDGQSQSQSEDWEEPRPHFFASAGSVVFLPGIHRAAERAGELNANSRVVGVVRVAARGSLVASFEALGHLDVLLWMLSAAVEEASHAGDAVLACDVVGVMTRVVERSAMVRHSLRDKSQSLSRRLLAGVTHALSAAPPNASYEELVLALCGLVDCCAGLGLLTKPGSAGLHGRDDAWARSLARKAPALHDEMVSCWLLQPAIWRARRVKPGNVGEHLCLCLRRWARDDPRRLLANGSLGSDELANVLVGLLALSNTRDQLATALSGARKAGEGVVTGVGAGCHEDHEGGGARGQVYLDLALPVCLELLAPSLLVSRGAEGRKFLKQQLVSVARLILGVRSQVRIAGLTLVGKVIVQWREHFSWLVEALSGEGLDCPRLILSLMHDSNGDQDVLGLALNTLVTFLTAAAESARQGFLASGGFSALELILCRREMSDVQQRACVKCILQWLSVPFSKTLAALQPSDSLSDVADWHAKFVLLIRILEVTSPAVRLEAVRGLRSLFLNSTAAALHLIGLSAWPDLLLSVVHALGGSAQAERGDLCYDEVMQIISCVVDCSLRCSRRGWTQLSRALAALSRLRLVVDEDDEEDFGVGVRADESLERRLTASARLVLVSSIKTMQDLVESMPAWDEDALSAPAALSPTGAPSAAASKGAAGDVLSKGAREVREDLAGLMVMVHVFLLSRFTEEQRTSLTVASRAELLPSANTNASGNLLLLRALRMNKPCIRVHETGTSASDSGAGAWVSGGGDTWLDRTIVSDTLALLQALTAKPRAPAVPSVKDMSYSERGVSPNRAPEGSASVTMLDSNAWPAAGYFLSVVLLHETLGRMELTGDKVDADALHDSHSEVVLACKMMTSCGVCASEEGSADSPIYSFSNDASPWATFAINIARQYAQDHASSEMAEPLKHTALRMCQYSTHKEIYMLSSNAEQPRARSHGCMVRDICEHHRARESCSDCKCTSDKESAAEKTRRLLRVPLDKSVATLSEHFAPDGNDHEEEEKERRYHLLLSGEDIKDRPGDTNSQDSQFPLPDGTALPAPASDFLCAGMEEASVVESGAEGKENVLACLDWSLPSISGHLAHATLQICAYERQMLGQWCENIEQGEKELERAALAREVAAMELLRHCEDLQAESESWENKRAQRRREQSSALMQATARGWNEILQGVETVPPTVHPQLRTMSARTQKLRWKLDLCENSLRQRRRLIPFPDFVEHPPRHVWDAAQDGGCKGGGEGGVSDAGPQSADEMPCAPASAVTTLLPEALVQLDKGVINQLLLKTSSGASLPVADDGCNGRGPLDAMDEARVALMPEGGDFDIKEEDEEEDDEACEENEVLDDDQEWVHVEADADVLHSWSCEMVTAAAVCAGTLELTRTCLSFIPDPARSELRKTPRDDAAALALLCSEKRSWAADELTQIHGRRYLLRDTALELFFTSDPPVFLNFPIPQEVHQAEGEHAEDAGGKGALNMGGLLHLTPGRSQKSEVGAVYKAVLARKLSNLTIHYLRAPQALEFSRVQDDWMQRRISSFEYLMHLNSFAGRSLNDLTQYPVFPWVLKDYTSQVLRLDDPESYRDLSRPIGAQHESMRQKLRARYDTWCDDEIPPFHFGTHYSTPGYVLWYLLRLEPFTTTAVHLQGARFDVPDRMFWSVAEAFKNCTTSIADVKELIPEFFYLPNFLENECEHAFGVLQSGVKVDQVELPPWAEGSPQRFIRLHREALESEYVSANLHHWIDLIFGCKQTGVSARDALNSFYFLTYQDAIDTNALKSMDPQQRAGIEAQIADYGQTPRQLFSQPHPARRPPDEVAPPVFVGPELTGVKSVHGHSHSREPVVRPFGDIVCFPVGKVGADGSGSAAAAVNTPGVGRSVAAARSSHVGVALCDWCAGGKVVIKVGEDGGVQRWSWDPNVVHNGNPFKLEPLYLSLRSQLQAASTAEDVAKGVGKGLISLARGFKNAAVTAITSGDPLSTNVAQMFLDRRTEAVMPAGGQGQAGRGVTVVLERSNGHSIFGGLHLATGRRWARHERSSLLFRAGEANGTVRVYFLTKSLQPVCVQARRLHQSCVTCMGVTRPEGAYPRGPFLVTGGSDGSVRIWRLRLSHRTIFDAAGRVLRRPLPVAPDAVVHCHKGAVACLALSEGLDAGVSAARDGSCSIFSLSSGRLTRLFSHPAKASVQLLALSREGDVVMYSQADGLLHLFDVNATPITSTSVDRGSVSAMLVSPDGLLLFAGTSHGHVYIYRLASLSLLTCFPPPAASVGKVDTIALSPCNDFVLTGYSSGDLSVHTNEAQIVAHLKRSLQDLGIGEGGMGAL